MGKQLFVAAVGLLLDKLLFLTAEEQLTGRQLTVGKDDSTAGKLKRVTIKQYIGFDKQRLPEVSSERKSERKRVWGM